MQFNQRSNEYITFNLFADENDHIEEQTITVRKDSIYSYHADRSDSAATIETTKGIFKVTVSPYEIQKMLTRHAGWRINNGR